MVTKEDGTGSMDYSPHKRPDITVFDYDGNGNTLIVEISVYRPTAQTHLARAASEDPSAAGTHKETVKLAEYAPPDPTVTDDSTDKKARRAKDFFRSKNVRWVPFIVDTWGKLSPKTHAFLQYLADRQQQQSLPTDIDRWTPTPEFWSAACFISEWRQRISAALKRSIARIIATRARWDFRDEHAAGILAAFQRPTGADAAGP